MWRMIETEHAALRRWERFAVLAFLAAATASCLDDCDNEGFWCEENKIVDCNRGPDDPYDDCDVFNMVCVETRRLAEDRPVTTCALSDQPCEADAGTICVGNRLGVCGITEYPVCEQQYDPGSLGEPSDCTFCE